jgi:putative ABC transport system substrate-binding protein
MPVGRTNRRAFIAALSSAAAWPLAAQAQQPAIPMIGFLSSASADAYAPLLAAFRQGLKGASYVEGQNVAIESRWAEGQLDRVPELAADLAQRGAAIIVTTGVTSTLAAKAANSTIPLVFLSQEDPVKLGLVASFNHPGGNATGISLLTGPLVAKRLEFVRQLVPRDAPIFYLMNPRAAEAQYHPDNMQIAGRDAGQQFVVLSASSERDIDGAFAALAKKSAGALIVSTDPFFVSRINQIVVLAAYNKIPAIYDRREAVVAGGLVSYGTHLVAAYRQMGAYTGEILKGAKPADLPVLQPTTFELVINLKTAKALGLTVPPALLSHADEVIE